MGNNLRCCLACMIPCGALDLIRIVHLNGVIEEITSPVTAGEVLRNYPNHVLSKPSSQGIVRRIIIVSGNSELKRGSIYFLIPESSVPESKRKPRRKISEKPVSGAGNAQVTYSGARELLLSGGGVAEKKVGRRRVRRTGNDGDWRPPLESILEEQ